MALLNEVGRGSLPNCHPSGIIIDLCHNLKIGLSIKLRRSESSVANEAM